MNVLPIPRFAGSPQDAHDKAKKDGVPQLVPVSIYADDRGWSHMNLYQHVLSPDGQINYSVMYPQVIKAWHRHQRQTDFWLCVHGHIKVGVHRESDGAMWRAVIGEKHPAIVIIPPTLWHGVATVGSQDAGLLYYVTHAYDPKQPDEDRRNYDSVSGFSWQVEHR